MPTVRRAQSRVERTALPGVRVSTDAPAAAFGVASAPDLSGPTKLVAAIDQEQRQHAAQIKLQDADTALDKLQTDLERTAQQRRGVDALGAKDEVKAGWEKGVSEIETTLGNASGELKVAFRGRANTRWTRLYGGVEAYTAAQMREHDTTSTNAALINRVQGATKYPDMAPKLAAESHALVTDYGRRQGWSPEKLQEEQTKWTSRVHTGAIAKLVDAGDATSAKAYFEQHQAEISGEDQLRLSKPLQEGNLLGKAQRNADAILRGRPVAAGLVTEGSIDLTRRPKVKNADGSVSTVRSMSFEEDGKEILVPTVTPDGKNLTNEQAIARYKKTGEHLGIFKDAESATAYAKQLHEAQAAALEGRGDGTVAAQGRAPTRTAAYEQARAIADPDERKATEQQLDIEFARRERAEREQYEGLQQRAYGFVEQGRRPPATVWAGLTVGDKRAFSQMLESNARGEPVRTDFAAFYGLMQDASSTDPKARDRFAKTNLLSYVNKLSGSDLQEMARLQGKVRKGEEDEVVRGFMTTTAIVDEGIAPLKLKDGSPEKVAFRRAVDDDIAAAKRATGKTQLSPDEERKIVSRRVVQLYVDTPRARDPKKPIAELTPNEQGRAYFAGAIPPGEAQELRALMKANGVSATDNFVRRAYAAMLIGDRAMFDRVVGASQAPR